MNLQSIWTCPTHVAKDIRQLYSLKAIDNKYTMSLWLILCHDSKIKQQMETEAHLLPVLYKASPDAMDVARDAFCTDHALLQRVWDTDRECLLHRTDSGLLSWTKDLGLRQLPPADCKPANWVKTGSRLGQDWIKTGPVTCCVV